MTLFALDALARDPSTEAVVLISKPPHPDVLGRLQAALEKVGKPAVVCCLGAKQTEGAGALWVRTLDEAADATVARLRGRPWSPRTFHDVAGVREGLTRLPALSGSAILGLYTGGTLAHEAHLVLEELLGARRADRILDLGDDQYTVGRPHPMIDPQVRSDLLVEAGGRREVGLILTDLVLGSGAHPNPAEPLAAAFERARARAETEGRRLLGVASIVGTRSDRQDLDRQAAQLRQAGMEVLPSNAEAARFAALLVQPDLRTRVLEEK
jgi:FdrA protein